MSIFQQKLCPQCSDSQPLAAPRCGCGYLFEVERVEDDTHAAELQAQQERLYLDYLAARVAQAEEAYRVAKRLLEADPESAVKSADVLLAQQQMHAAQAELAEQTIRTRAAVARAETLRRAKLARTAPRHAETSPPKRGEPPTPPAISGREPARALATAAPDLCKAIAAQPPQDSSARVPAPQQRAGAKPAVAGSPVPPSVTAPGHHAPNTLAAAAAHGPQPQVRPKAAMMAARPQDRFDARRDAGTTGLPRVEMAPARIATANPSQSSAPAAISQPTIAPPAPAPARPEAPSRGAMLSAQPTPAFREAQATKAREIISRREGQAPEGPGDGPTAASSRNRAAQLAMMHTAEQAKEQTKDCPSCTAVVAVTVMRCRCGFAFSSGAELPPVVLTPAERAALLQGLELTGPRKLA